MLKDGWRTRAQIQQLTLRKWQKKRLGTNASELASKPTKEILRNLMLTSAANHSSDISTGYAQLILRNQQGKGSASGASKHKPYAPSLVLCAVALTTRTRQIKARRPRLRAPHLCSSP